VGIPISDQSPRLIEKQVILGTDTTIKKSDDTATRNPWLLAKELEDRVSFFRREKYSLYDGPIEGTDLTPPFALDDFLKLIEAAESIAPEYPLVRTARYYYEIERGDKEAARAYSQFIPDETHMKAMYHYYWEG
jgi:hypothetical protein